MHSIHLIGTELKGHICSWIFAGFGRELPLRQTLWYGIDEDPKEYVITAGDSVLGSLLWNAMHVMIDTKMSFREYCPVSWGLRIDSKSFLLAVRRQ